MLRASIIFFVLGIVSMILGLNSIAGPSIDIGKLLLVVFLVLSILSFLLGRRKGKSLVIAFTALISGANYLLTPAHAEELNSKVKEAANDTKRAAKNAVKTTKDSTCTLIKGKTECEVQKVKHAIQKGADNVEDAID